MSFSHPILMEIWERWVLEQAYLWVSSWFGKGSFKQNRRDSNTFVSPWRILWPGFLSVLGVSVSFSDYTKSSELSRLFIGIIPRLPAQILTVAYVHIWISFPLPQSPVLVLTCFKSSEIKIILIETQTQLSDSGSSCPSYQTSSGQTEMSFSLIYWAANQRM